VNAQFAAGKHPTLVEVMQKLSDVLDFSNVTEVDYWDADRCATGLLKDDRLIYISTWKYHDALLVKYFCEIEHVDQDGVTIAVLHRSEDTSFDALTEIIRTTLRLNNRS
jgi:hypothetical protein